MDFVITILDNDLRGLEWMKEKYDNTSEGTISLEEIIQRTINERVVSWNTACDEAKTEALREAAARGDLNLVETELLKLKGK